MANLIAKTPCEGLLPITHGGATLSEAAPDVLMSIMPYAGREEATSAALKAAHGIEMPAPNRVSEAAGTRAIWSGAGQAMVTTTLEPTLAQHAALTDQSDAWAVLRLSGAGAEAVMARLTPIDLNGAVFKPGHSARTQFAHMNAVVSRISGDSFEVMVFRSMAKWAVHEIEIAMKGVAAREGVTG